MVVEVQRDPAAEIAALAPGTVFHGGFEVVRCIKAGGMGAVYEVLQTSTQRYRALKVMLPSLVTDPEMRARFELEAKIAAGIESEHIVETIDAGIDQATGMPFIVMELLKGEELGALLKSRKRLPPADVVTYLYQAALALDRTHAAGIIHRDLKPENLYLTHRDDGSPRVKILDFGVAKIVADGSVNASSTKTVGSPMYMGPEQISGELKVGPAVDRYSLAHIAFTLLVGRPYWHIERKASDGLFPFMVRLMKGAKVSGSMRAAHYGVKVPEAFDPWFQKATSLDPTARFDGSAEMISELARVFDVPLPTRPVSLPPPQRAPLPTAPNGLPPLAPPVNAAPAESPPNDAVQVKADKINASQVEAANVSAGQLNTTQVELLKGSQTPADAVVVRVSNAGARVSTDPTMPMLVHSPSYIPVRITMTPDRPSRPSRIDPTLPSPTGFEDVQPKPSPKVEVVSARSDEPSVQPMTLNRAARAWVVPVSLLAAIAAGFVAAFIVWPLYKRVDPQYLNEDSGTQLPSAQDVPSVAPLVSTTSTTTAPEPVISAAPESSAKTAPSPTEPAVAPPETPPVQPTASTSALFKPPAPASTKPAQTKGKDVLDQY